MWCLFIRGSQDVEFCRTHPTLPLSCFYALLLPQAHVSLVIPSRFHVEFMYIDWYLRGCESVRKLLKLWLVVVEGGMATRIVCCAESQNTGSTPLLSDLYCAYVCWMEHEGLYGERNSGSSGLKTILAVPQANCNPVLCFYGYHCYVFINLSQLQHGGWQC